MTSQTKEKGLIKVNIICWGGLSDRITYGGVVVVLRLYSLEQCPDLNFGHRLKLVNLLLFTSF